MRDIAPPSHGRSWGDERQMVRLNFVLAPAADPKGSRLRSRDGSQSWIGKTAAVTTTASEKRQTKGHQRDRTA